MKGWAEVDVVEYAKMLYTKSELGAAVCDSSFRVLWKNRGDIPDELSQFFSDEERSEQPLSFDKEALLKCIDGEAARILPFEEKGSRCYLVEFYPSLSIQKLICSSEKLHDIEVQNENVRKLITQTLTVMNAPQKDEEPEKLLERLRHDVSLSVLHVLASNVNFSYLSRLMDRGAGCVMVNITARLGETLSYLTQILNSSGTKLLTDIAPRIIGACDYYYFEAAVLNLVINAHDYARCDEKQISVSLSSSDDRREYIVTVSDNGTAADIERITAASYFTTGRPELDGREHLGLPFTRYYTELIGGRMELAPSETGGLTVNLIYKYDNGVAVKDLRMDHKTFYNNIFDPCFCILAKAVDPTVYEVKYDMQSLFSDIIRKD